VIVRDHVWWPPRDRGPSAEARIPAAAAALFFALAPLNSQPVDFMWARSALLCGTLYLGAFLAFVRRRWSLGAVLFALALLTKAIAITLPVMLLIHDFVYRDRTRYPTVRRYVMDGRRLTLPLVLPALLAAAYVAYRAIVLPPWAAEARHEAWVTPWIWFISQWSALLYYVRLFVWQDALRNWEDTLRKSPSNGRAWMNAGQNLMSRGELAAARRYFERARQLAPRSAFVYMNLCMLEAREGHLEEALHAASEAVRLRPDFSPSYLLLGNVLAKSGRTEEAAAAYRRAAALDPRDRAAPQALARLASGADQDEALMRAGLDALRPLHDPARAAALFRQGLEHSPTHYGATFQLAAALDAAGRTGEARP